MAVQEKTRWKHWADTLRQEMMQERVDTVTKSIETIAAETATSKVEKTLQSERYWRSCREGSTPNESLVSAGFVIEFTPDANKAVREVTFKLNATWSRILQSAIDKNTVAS